MNHTKLLCAFISLFELEFKHTLLPPSLFKTGCVDKTRFGSNYKQLYYSLFEVTTFGILARCEHKRKYQSYFTHRMIIVSSKSMLLQEWERTKWKRCLHAFKFPMYKLPWIISNLSLCNANRTSNGISFLVVQTFVFFSLVFYFLSFLTDIIMIIIIFMPA